MRYETKLIIRILIALSIFIIPYSLITKIFLKATIAVVYFLSSFSYSPIINHNSIIIDNKILDFIPACIATSAYLLFYLLILLTKDINLKKMIYIALIGSLIIFILNIIRIEILISVFLNYGVNLFNKIHFIFWSLISTTFVAIVWIFLSYKFKIKEIPLYSDIKYLLKKSKKRKKLKSR